MRAWRSHTLKPSLRLTLIVNIEIASLHIRSGQASGYALLAMTLNILALPSYSSFAHFGQSNQLIKKTLPLLEGF